MDNILTNNKENKKINGLSTIVLKMLATIFMTIDHIGHALEIFTNDSSLNVLIYILRFLGRFAFPIFIFLLIEGLYHTSNIKKYLLRLGIGSLLNYISITLIQIISNNKINFNYDGNIFLTLFILALLYYFINYSKYKFLVFIPILYIIASLAIKLIFVLGFYTINEVSSFIYFNGLFLQFDILGPILFIFILVSYKIYDRKIANTLGNDINAIEKFKASNEYQKSKNILVCIIIAILSLVCYLITYLPFYQNGIELLSDCALQSGMFFSSLLIFFYNGRKGYSNKKIKYIFYLYYPLHIVLIYLIFSFIF